MEDKQARLKSMDEKAPRGKSLTTSGQITTTSAEVTSNGGLVREYPRPQNGLKSGQGVIINCPTFFSMLGFQMTKLLRVWVFIISGLELRMTVVFLKSFKPKLRMTPNQANL